jgi:hypothetical protein
MDGMREGSLNSLISFSAAKLSRFVQYAALETKSIATKISLHDSSDIFRDAVTRHEAYMFSLTS